MTKEDEETLTRYFMQREREGNLRDEDGHAIILNGANREFREVLEKLGNVYNELPTIGLKETFIKSLEGVLEFGESVVRMAATDVETLDRIKANAAQAEDRLKDILETTLNKG